MSLQYYRIGFLIRLVLRRSYDLREIAWARTVSRNDDGANRYVGETKQNAEVTAKKQASVQQLFGSSIARKVKFTVDRQRCARDSATSRTYAHSRLLMYSLVIFSSRCKIRRMQ